MKTYPVIFSAPMVRALLDGSKTQTRRLSWHKSNGGVDRLFPWPTVWQQVKPGDMLWIRESWSFDDAGEFPDGRQCIHVEYLADHERVWLAPDRMPKSMRTFPSIHMPRGLSRLTLEVTDVRLQRVHEIDERDATAEGMERFGIGWRAWEGQPAVLHARHAFQDCWRALHGPASWDVNPEVIALTFRVHRQNIDQFIGGAK